jgi:hypothetical protein
MLLALFPLQLNRGRNEKSEFFADYEIRGYRKKMLTLYE